MVESFYFTASDFIDLVSESSSMANIKEFRSITSSSLLIPLIGIVLLFFGPVVVSGQGLFPVMQREPGAILKNYTGVRARTDSLRQIYYCDQTIAIVELGPGKELQNCELIEVYSDAKLALRKKNLMKIARPIRIKFAEMEHLMTQCQMLDPPIVVGRSLVTTATKREVSNYVNPFSLFSGILPGTKWCGTGDIAESYFDLGESTDLDKCCRTHDLCPSKVRAFTSRYNLTNYSLYTKSHCACDTMFYECLKSTKNPTASVMGNLYFNIVRVPCVEDINCTTKRCSEKQFKTSRRHY